MGGCRVLDRILSTRTGLLLLLPDSFPMLPKNDVRNIYIVRTYVRTYAPVKGLRFGLSSLARDEGLT